MNRKQLINTICMVAFIVLLCLLPLFLKSIYWTHILILTAFNVLLAVSLRTISRTGQISLGTAGFMLLGGYASALLVMKVGLSFWIAMPLGGLLAAAVALAIGYPFLKVKGIYFAILTLLLAEVCRLFAGYWEELSGGMTGLKNIPAPNPITIPGIATITFDNKIAYYYLVLVIVVLSLFILYRMEHARLGLTWAAIKEADTLAASVGINIMGHKVFNFSVGCFFTGIVGALFAHYTHLLSPSGAAGGKFGVMTSIFILIYMVVGGEASFAGPIVGATLLTMIPEIARPLKEYQPLLLGGLLILIVFFMPKGLISLRDRLPLWYGKTLRHLKKDRLGKG